MDIFQIVVALFKWLLEAAVQHASTDEGEATLKSILDALEANGVDVPFYEPQQSSVDTQGAGQPEGFQNISDRAAAARDARRAAREANRQ